MSIIDWLMEYLFKGAEVPVQYMPYVYMTACVITILLICLVVRALSYALNIFIH